MRTREYKPVSITKIHNTRNFYRALLTSLSRKPKCVTVVSPFVGQLPRSWKDMANFARFLISQDIGFCLVTRPPDLGSTGCITFDNARILVQLGVDLRIRSAPKLHSKLYYVEYKEGDYSAFIGSANFTIGGLETNEETMAEFRGALDHEKIQGEVIRLRDYGASSFTQWAAGRRNIV
jgi:hypothetical protein